MVMDEVHFLADRMRGPVWEEVILRADDVQVVSLSATGEQRRGQFGSKRWGDTTVVVDEHRPEAPTVATHLGGQAHVRPVRLPDRRRSRATQVNRELLLTIAHRREGRPDGRLAASAPGSGRPATGHPADRVIAKLDAEGGCCQRSPS